MKNVYLSLAIIGAIVPYLFFFDFFAAAGVDLGAFIAALFVNGAAGGFTADLLITSLAFWIFLWQKKVANLWIYILLNLTIGLSCALPAYLYMRARAENG